MGATCHVCQTPELIIHPDFERLHRVASDATPFRPGGTLALCTRCGTVQTPPTDRWKAECAEVYNRYNIYHQSAGKEQQVFGNEAAQGRSQRLAKLIGQRLGLPKTGTLLDVGCANGCFLRAWADTHEWTLSGCEFDRRHEPVLRQIRRFEALYSEGLSEIQRRFDLITFIHVLEHLPQPHRILNEAAERLAPGGFLVVQVPDCLNNAPVLTVADHSTHFGPASLAGTGRRAGLETVLSESLLPKELTLVLKKGQPGTSPDARAEGQEIFRHADTLRDIAAYFRRLNQTEPGTWGIFGTAIAATWLAQEVPMAAQFFVDEDTSRQGRTHMGKPILGPADVPTGSRIIVAMPEPMGNSIRQRLQRTGVRYDRFPS